LDPSRARLGRRKKNKKKNDKKTPPPKHYLVATTKIEIQQPPAATALSLCALRVRGALGVKAVQISLHPQLTQPPRPERSASSALSAVNRLVIG
jgi:hypothetical protein